MNLILALYMSVCGISPTDAAKPWDKACVAKVTQCLVSYPSEWPDVVINQCLDQLKK